MRSISKIIVKRISDSEFSYARQDTLVESLHVLDTRETLPILDALEMLSRSSSNSVSLSRDRPFCYFYARKNGDDFDITLRMEDREIDFKIPKRDILTV